MILSKSYKKLSSIKKIFQI